MKRATIALAIVLASPATQAFNFLGVVSGQSPEKVETVLARQGIAVKKISDDAYSLAKENRHGWAGYCHGELNRIGFSFPYRELPDLLASAIEKHGDGELKVEPHGIFRRSYYVTHFWHVDNEIYTVTLVTMKDNTVSNVIASWGTLGDCPAPVASDKQAGRSAE